MSSLSSSTGKSMPSATTDDEADFRMSLPPDFSLQKELKQRPSYTKSNSSIRSVPSFVLDEEKCQVSLIKDFHNAKAYLMQCGDIGISLWTHLTELLKKVVEERPTNVIDYFEEYSRRLKSERFSTVNQHLKDKYMPPCNLDFARTKINLLRSLGNIPQEDDEEGPEAQPVVEGEEAATRAGRAVGLLELMNFFRESGVALPLEEIFAINVALLNLNQTAPIKSSRFWGKIFGLQRDYIVAECELNETELNRRLEEQLGEEALEEQNAVAAAIKEDAETLMALQGVTVDADLEEGEEEDNLPPPIPLRETYKIPELPVPPQFIETVIPKEKDGEGANKKVYYVCNYPGEPWELLPNTTPEFIIAARKIKKYFTGNLNTCIVSYPVFPGTERNYLRAQIARISAGTQISPLGFYTFNEGGEEEEQPEEEEEETKSTYVENSEFDPLPVKDLVDPTMAFWVHHSQHILKQGRAKFWSAKAPVTEEEGGEEEEDEEEAGETEIPEVGPPLLTPLSEDASLEMTSPWSVRNTSAYTPENSIAFVVSNLWPGAYAFATGRIFGNVYIGSGLKYSASGYSPAPLPFPEEEYLIGPEVMEIDDPSPEAEEEWRLAHEPKPKKVEDEEEEEEEDEEAVEPEDD